MIIIFNSYTVIIIIKYINVNITNQEIKSIAKFSGLISPIFTNVC